MVPEASSAFSPSGFKDETLLFFGGPIHTLTDRSPQVEAVGVRGDRIVAVGTKACVEAALGTAGGRRPRPIDLKGATLLPGLVDSHTHFLDYALFLDFVDLDGIRTLQQALDQVAKFAASVPKGHWVRGGRWNKNLWGRFPSRHDLDRVVPDHPVALSSKDMHSWWLNSAGLRLVGVTRDTPDPPGGEIERDAGGDPTGILKENAAMFLWDAIGQMGPSGHAASLRKAIGLAHEMGLVGLCDMEGREALKHYQALERDGDLSLRVWMYVPSDMVPHLGAIGVESGFGGRNVRIAGIKAFLDGSLGSQTADMLAPFEGGAGRGIATMTPEAFGDLVDRASAEGLAVAVHAIGDRATRTALDAFEKHRLARRGAGLRHRIEHLQLLDPGDLPRVGRLGVVASMQPLHGPSDRDIADKHWGPKRSRFGYAWRSVAASGAVLAFGSDVPVETCDPLQGLFAAVTRRHPAEPAREPWYFEQAVTPLAAVRAYTIGAAWAVGAESERGSLEPGKLADFTILSEDILNVGAASAEGRPARAGSRAATAGGPTPAEAEAFGEVVLKTKVVATVVGGRFVFGGSCLQ